MAFADIPLETVDGIIADWNALARKHGISVSGPRQFCLRLFRLHYLLIHRVAAIFSTELSHVDAGGAGR